MIRCKVCQLGSGRREVIDLALRSGQASLLEISASTGCSKSSLHRHRQHLVGPPPGGVVRTVHNVPDGITTVVTEPREALPAIVAEDLPVAPACENVASPRPTTKAELLNRLEFLWRESLDGLEASKQPIRISKPDGSTIEVSGDLRSRPAFIRESRHILELQAAANGDLAAGPTAPILIVMPSASATPSSDPSLVINLPLPRRRAD